MLTTHVGGNRASTPMALMYFDEFERVNQERRARVTNVKSRYYFQYEYQ